MSLREEERQVIVTLELEKADKTWAQMEVQIEANQWELVARHIILFHSTNPENAFPASGYMRIDVCQHLLNLHQKHILHRR